MKTEFFKNQTVNFHLWEPCNMKCGFCFAQFQDVKNSILPKGHLGKSKSIDLVKELASAGFDKINFAGGEPTLCPWLKDLIVTAKSYGVTTSIVSNGSKIHKEFLKSMNTHLDWIGISIDSVSSATNRKSGRIFGKVAPDFNYYLDLCNSIKESGYRLKLNTVVNNLNKMEILSHFVDEITPERWKVLQVLKVIGQNEMNFNKFSISENEFNNFMNRNRIINEKTSIVKESNSMIKGSYIMVDPAGRFFDDTKGVHTYSQPILKVGILNALSEVRFDKDKYIKRGGVYNW